MAKFLQLALNKFKIYQTYFVITKTQNSIIPSLKSSTSLIQSSLLKFINESGEPGLIEQLCKLISYRDFQ